MVFESLYLYLYLYLVFLAAIASGDPPDSIPNSEVKTLCADDSVGFHVKVGHRQVFISWLLQTKDFRKRPQHSVILTATAKPPFEVSL